MRSSQSIGGAVCLGLLVLACGTDPVPEGRTLGGDSGDNSSGESGSSGSSSVSQGDGGSSGSSNSSSVVPGNVSGLVLTVGNEPETDNCRAVSDCADNECGPVPDNCNNIIECGDCEGDEICGGGGPSLCGVIGSNGTSGGEECTPSSCGDLGKACGTWPDGCDGAVTCDAGCSLPEICSVSSGECVVPAACDDLRTCDYYAGQDNLCGDVSNGCGGLLDCGFTCTAENESCGVVEAGVCGTTECVPSNDCAAALAELHEGYCGAVVSDGCGGTIAGCDTAACAAGETCGGGAVDGGVSLEICRQGTSEPCVPAECGSTNCGEISDGCGSSIVCGELEGECSAGLSCNGGECLPVNVCEPKTCEALNAECGEIADGCGGENVVCEDTCVAPEACGIGGANDNTCGAVAACETISDTVACSNEQRDCGYASIGCNEVTAEVCGFCDAGAEETCVDGKCVAPEACLPQTCGELGSTCGATPDGCGSNFIVGGCGTCLEGSECIGNGTGGTCVEIETPCEGLCQQQSQCDPGEATRVTGVIRAPNGVEPLYNALIYVPNLANMSDLPAITTGPNCVACEDEELGNPLVAQVTGPDGAFSLENVPAGVEFPLVVKMGKWRRVVMIPPLAACSDNALGIDDARLPQHMSDAAVGMTDYVNIPQMAMATGEVDSIECVLRKIGVDDQEFSDPSGTGRIHLYRGARGAVTGCSGDLNESNLCDTEDLVYTDVGELFTGETIDNYDVALFDCEGAAENHEAHEVALREWADEGGRVFASHYSYKYLDTNGDFATTAVWDGTNEYKEAYYGNWSTRNNPTTGIIDLTHEKGQDFNSWLGLDSVSAYDPTYGSGFIQITDPRGYVRSVDPALTDHFVSIDETEEFNVDTAVQQYSFNTPVGTPAADACGRVLYSAFHVADTKNNLNRRVFPEHCVPGPLSAQEKVLEFMIFDLSSCITNETPPTCTPTTCEALGATCGALTDGCGGELQCGTCVEDGEFCGGGGENQCGSSCTQTSCAAEGAECGVLPDGCGGVLPSCGECTGDATCGGGGQGNICGEPACVKRTCAEASAECGSLADGCGETLDCGNCEVDGESCLGNQCGSDVCAPKTCEQMIAAEVGQKRCGPSGDGCSGLIASCGECAVGSECGVGGPSLCGPTCTPVTCVAQNANCGTVADGCGGAIQCGTCGEGTQCGVDNICVIYECDPTTCEAEGATCGTISDGCGGSLSCGTCGAGEECGAEVANQCGAGSCTPDTSCDGKCGANLSDGCSNVFDCDPCDCVPQTCEQQSANCGPVPNGCGALIEGGCGTCTGGNSCGGGGTPSQCGGALQ